MRNSAEKCTMVFGYSALSGRCVPGLTAQEIAIEVGTKKLPHDEIRAASAADLRSAGYEVIWQGSNHHVQILLDNLPAMADKEAFDTVFGEPEDNPVARSLSE